MTAYGYEKTLPGVELSAARERVVEALAAEGFGILTEVDIRATLKKKLDVDFRPYIILGACNPGLAHEALQAEPQIGLLLPCNVVIQSQDDGVLVSVANPLMMGSVTENADLDAPMQDADARLKRVLGSL